LCSGDIVHDGASLPKARIVCKSLFAAELLYMLQLAGGQQLLVPVPSHWVHAVDGGIGICLDISHMLKFSL
jgi:hypothetical protein